MSATPGVEIRPETDADHDAIGEVVAAAFGSEVEARLVERIRASPEYLPDLALVAVSDGEVVGHVMISGALLRDESGERPIVMLSPLAVRPDRQGCGVGSALVRAALAGAEARGQPFVVLEGSPGYYGRLGFEPASRYEVTLPIPDWAPPDAAQLAPLAGFDPDDLPSRGAVVYPAAFDGLE